LELVVGEGCVGVGVGRDVGFGEVRSCLGLRVVGGFWSCGGGVYAPLADAVFDVGASVVQREAAQVGIAEDADPFFGAWW